MLLFKENYTPLCSFFEKKMLLSIVFRFFLSGTPDSPSLFLLVFIWIIDNHYVGKAVGVLVCECEHYLTQTMNQSTN